MRKTGSAAARPLPAARHSRLRRASNRLFPGEPPRSICAPLLSAASCPVVPRAAEGGHKAGSFDHHVTTTLTLIRTLCGTKKRIFPIISTRFTFLLLALETRPQFQQQRAAVPGVRVRGHHAIKATNNLPSAILLVGQQFSRWPTLPSPGKASPPWRDISALICNTCDVSKLLS